VHTKRTVDCCDGRFDQRETEIWSSGQQRPVIKIDCAGRKAADWNNDCGHGSKRLQLVSISVEAEKFEKYTRSGECRVNRISQRRFIQPREYRSRWVVARIRTKDSTTQAGQRIGIV